MKRIITTVLVLMMTMGICGSASAEWLYATKGDTHIRLAPNLESEDLGVFYKGEKVWVNDHVYTSDGRNWCQIWYYGKTAYVSDRYSSYEVSNPDAYEEIGGTGVNVQPYEEPYDDNGEGNYYYEGYDTQFAYQSEFEFWVIQSTEVRLAPTYDSKPIGAVQYGDYVYGSMIYTSGDGTAWLEVLRDGNQFGYIPMSALRLTEALVDNTFPTLAEYMVVTGGRVNVREDANINSEDLGTIHEGDIVVASFMVCVEDGERRIWAYCFDEDWNPIGFVSTKYLTAAEG